MLYRAADIRSVWKAEDLAPAQTKLAAMIEKYSGSAPQLAVWMENNLPEGFTVFGFPEPIRKGLRTSTPTSRRLSTSRSAAAPASRPSFPTPKVAGAWSPPSAGKSPKPGNLQNSPQSGEKLLLNPMGGEVCL